jgi:RNA polymerase sigma factor (sigma-70 family)
VSTVKGFGEDFFAEDIVQESYIKIIKYCREDQLIKDGEVRKAYMYFVLRNMFLDFKKQKNNKNKVSTEVLNYLGEGISNDLEEIQRADALNKIFDKVDTVVKDLHWYDELLFKLYRDTGKSMRTLSKETGISTSSIFTTLKKCKDAIREEVSEDYQDYLNEEYELI